jgi:hypothetical protein
MSPPRRAGPRCLKVAVLALAAGAAMSACGARLLRLPEGPGAPASDADAVVGEAMRACRAVSTMAAAAAVSGSIGGRRVRGRIDLGLAAPASARLEAVAPFGLLFTFVARGDVATLVLHRDGRALERGPSEAVLEAVAGVPLGPADLRLALTGCAADPDTRAVRRLADEWRVVPDGARLVYVRREPPEPWRVVAVVVSEPGGSGWRAEYRDFSGGLPRSIRLVDGDARRFDLRLTLSQVDLNVPLGPEVFEVQIPPSTTPISIEELREQGPLAAGASAAGDR